VPKIVILGATRTPIGAFSGRARFFARVPSWSVAIKSALAQADVDGAGVTDVLMGNVLQAGQGQAPARQAALYAGLPQVVRTVTIHKVCGSGLQAVHAGRPRTRCWWGRFSDGGMDYVACTLFCCQRARRRCSPWDHISWLIP